MHLPMCCILADLESIARCNNCNSKPKFALCRYDYVLEAVVTYTTALGMQQAHAADALLASGTYLGPLHGIPYGLKDIIAVKGYPTTWGAPQFRNQYINEDANVYQR